MIEFLDGRSLILDRRCLQAMYGESVSEMLTVQYRMNEIIMKWSSDELYQGKLTAASAVKSHTLKDITVRGG